MSKGFRLSHTDPCVFYRGTGRDLVYLLTHVDDDIIVGVKQSAMAARDEIAALFDITDAGEAQCFLSIEIKRSSRGIVLSQKQYCRRLLEQYAFKEGQCKGRETPMVMGANLVKEGTLLPDDNELRAKLGGFLYLACNTRPDISHSTTVLTKNSSHHQPWSMTMHANTFCDIYTNIRIWAFSISTCLKGNVNPTQEADSAGGASLEVSHCHWENGPSTLSPMSRRPTSSPMRTMAMTRTRAEASPEW
jgi:hypothetical protein